MNYPPVTIIILNWNNWRDTVECLESVFQIDYPNYHVILVDNGSTDDSIQKIREYCEGSLSVKSMFFEYKQNNKPIKLLEIDEKSLEDVEFTEEAIKNIMDLEPNRRLILIKNEKNYGFAEGNNIGIKFALKYLKPAYILLLNNDVVVEKNFLTELVNVFSIDPKIGIAGSLILPYDVNAKKDILKDLLEQISKKMAYQRSFIYPPRKLVENVINVLIGYLERHL